MTTRTTTPPPTERTVAAPAKRHRRRCGAVYNAADPNSPRCTRTPHPNKGKHKDGSRTWDR